MSEDDPESFWASQWAEGTPSWHLEEVNPFLKRNISHLCPPPDSHRVLVPMCGKSLDLKWMYDKGHSVTGVELLEDLVKNFFEENEMEHSVKDLGWAVVYASSDRRLQIYVGDIFTIKMEELGRFDALWDRGALVSIPPDSRARYAGIIKRALRPHFRVLISSFLYRPADTFEGPPFSVPNHTVHQLFGDIATWKVMEAKERMTKEEREEMGLEVFMESLLLLIPKRL